MATRMQQRRGTAAQWISTNQGNGPILAPGEIGFESDNNRFKMGDGINHWVDLPYFSDNEALTDLIGTAPALLNTLGELADALGDDPAFFTTVATNLSNHQSDTTNIHGIADTSLLATKSYADTAEADAITAAGTAADTKISNAVAALTKSSVGLGNVDNTSDANKPVSTATQTALDSKASNTNLSDHTSATTNVHGILDTDELATKEYVATEIGNSEVDQAALAGEGITWNGGTQQFDIDSTVATKTFAAGLLTGATKSNITITGDENGLTISAENGVADSNTDNLTEGSTNKYFTDERAQDAVGNAVGTGLTYTDSTGAISVTANTYDAYGSASAVAGDLSTHASDTTNIHGIADTSLLATKAYADAAVAAVVDAAPASLNTLKELATALADDANYATTVNNALAAKAPLASPAFTGTVTGITKSMVGLGNVDNTADTAKPVSDATQTALNLKANLAGPTFTGTVTVANGAVLGTPTSVTLTNGTGLPLTTGVTGTLPIANGGTGATTAATAAAALLPSQSSNSGKYLTTDGSGTLSWGTVSGYSAPTLGSTAISSGATVTTISGLTLTSPTLTGTITLPQGKLTGGSTTVSANTATTVSTVALADFTTMEYTVSIKQGSKIRSSKVLVQTDGTTVDSVEHSILETGGAMAGVNVTAAVSSTNAVLQVTVTDAATTNAVVKVINTIL